MNIALGISVIQGPYINVTTYLQSQMLPLWMQEIKLLVLFFSALCYFDWL